MTAHYNNCDIAAKKIIDHVGKNIVMGVPIGIGKPIGLLNALYRLACKDPSINLTIITGLTLARPILKNELEKRFITPILDRLLKDYVDPLYEDPRVKQQLPSNIKIIEFFLTTGKYLHNGYVQQNYISSKYTSVLDDSLYYSFNVLAQFVAHSEKHPEQYSLSCCADIFHGAAELLHQAKLAGKHVAIVGEVNSNLPFMPGDAIINSDRFTDIIDTGHSSSLFPLPREEISIQDHLIGFYSSLLVKDNGCLQVGIGKLGNAIANALILRHKQNNVYQDLIKKLSIHEKFSKEIASSGPLSSFEKGIYASTEMMSDEYMQLYKAGILKKRVYDNLELQRLLNKNQINENITPEMLDVLLAHKMISTTITEADFKFLQKFGIFKPEIRYQEGSLILPSDEKISADLTFQKSKQQIIEKCLGTKLTSGKLVHAGFFIGSVDFYKQLNALSPDELQQFDMTSVARTNALDWSPELLKLQRQDARLINFAMMLTLDGAVISDQIKNMQEVSGVGGQFDFVLMAHQLKGARSIIACRSTRQAKKGIESNIAFDYPTQTIPRYLRDIAITEYGIADCRSKTDAEVIKAMLNITDSRFQKTLLAKAKKSGKLPKDYEIPVQFQQNYPHVIQSILHEFQLKGYCKLYPFGSDLTAEEQVLQTALLYLKNCSSLKLFGLMLAALFSFKRDAKVDKYLVRMQLDHPKTIKEFIYKKLLKFIL